MARIILITGGARSGKSGHAQNLSEAQGGSRMFLATSPLLDDEMRHRVERHRLARANAGWDTVEEQLHIAQIIASDTSHKTILVDCLTL